MYISWAHHYIPKIFGSLAFIVNPIFVYLIFTEKLAQLGNYRFLLLYFATFNLVYSSTVFLIPLVAVVSLERITNSGFQDIYTYRYAFTAFISDGWFQEPSEFNVSLLSIRCCLISGSYAVLLSHFLYRYLAIRESSFTGALFPFYMIGSFLVFVVKFLLWFLVCAFLNSAAEGRSYIQSHFTELYDADAENFNFLVTIYNEASEETRFRSYFSVLLLSFHSVVSISLFVAFGFLTMRKINKLIFHMSKKTSQLQKDLLKALTVQTIIPLFVSFSPCLLSWYSPMLNLDFGRGINYLEVISLAAFPFCDPIAIVLCLPALRNRVFGKEKVNTTGSNSAL